MSLGLRGVVITLVIVGSSGCSEDVSKKETEEAAQLDAQMEKLLEPYVTRDASDAPGGARRVRWLRYLMPEAD